MTIDTHLGKKSAYASSYDNNLLVAIPRAAGRQNLEIPYKASLFGFDLWNCYELSWLNLRGKPEVRVMSFIIPSSSEYMPESKSIKLYLNSFNQTKFQDQNTVMEIIKSDLSNKLECEVKVIIYKTSDLSGTSLKSFAGTNIDDLDVDIDQYNITPSLLKLESDKNNIVEESLYSNLLKSNCLVTNQPDFASLKIEYCGPKIDHKSLLKYIISFRNHNEFHEQCVERIFCDITKHFSPSKLLVQAKFTRRGGVDISPVRANFPIAIENIDISRDVRQ